jgi:hypothetical protein
MFPKISRQVVLAALVFAVACFAAVQAVQAIPPPEQVITRADVAKVAGGNWKERSPEPGVIFYEEDGGEYRQINVYLFPPDGKTVADIRAAAEANSEEVQEIKGLGDGAIYRTQSREATLQKNGKDGPQILSVSVHEVRDGATAQKIAVELLKRGLTRL